jgi:hypothetical protein
MIDTAAGFLLALLLRGRRWWSSLDEGRQAALDGAAQPVRVSSMVQSSSHVRPPSDEKDCSQRQDVPVMSLQT